MCGIFGCIGTLKPITCAITGLKSLEYRGYDSAGIAIISNGKIIYQKGVGKIEDLNEKIKGWNFPTNLAISHTRWATHGKPSDINAHPHLDEKETVAVVHNGIIENYDALRKKLKSKGINFKSDTDTEIIPNLVALNYKGDFLKAVIETLKQLKGTFALALIHKDHPDQIIAATRESPLVIGYNDERTETLISSDPNAFLGKTLNVIFLKKDEVALIKAHSVEIYDLQHKEIAKKTELFEGKNQAPTKEGFEHFMLKEIFEQPCTVQNAILSHFSEEFGTAEFNNLNFSPKELMATRFIVILACGTSWHAGCIAASIFEGIARIPTQSEIASEFRFKNPIISDDTLVIAISQSGETADTIAALREAKAKGAKVLSICNVKNSTISREADSSIFLEAGPEISVCSTKAFTSQIAILTLFALFMARQRHMSKEEGQAFLAELKKIPQKIKQVLNLCKEIEELAKKYSKYESFFYIGRRYMYHTCLEAALKLKEISYLQASGYPAGEMKHGPIALINAHLPVIAFCANGQTYEKILSNMMEVKARGAPILAIAQEGSDEVREIADDIIWLPPTIDELATFPSTIAGQLFAYYIAKGKKRDIDHPRNLAKSVTVE